MDSCVFPARSNIGLSLSGSFRERYPCVRPFLSSPIWACRKLLGGKVQNKSFQERAAENQGVGMAVFFGGQVAQQQEDEG